MPQKILTDESWLGALTGVVELSRKLHKDVVVHTHFNHPNEITGITEEAMKRLIERGIHVRCQTVLQRTVNDRASVMQLHVRRLSYINIHPYYVFFHDMVPGVEDLRTTLQTGLKWRNMCAAILLDSIRRPLSSIRWAVVESAMRIPSNITTGRPGSPFSPVRA